MRKLLLQSRDDKDSTIRYHFIAEALTNLPGETIIDDEVVAFDDSGRPSFNKVQNYGSSRVPIYYYVFDLRCWPAAICVIDERHRLLQTELLSKLADLSGFRLRSNPRSTIL